MKVAAKSWILAIWLIATAMSGCQFARPTVPSTVRRADSVTPAPVSAKACEPIGRGRVSASTAEESVSEPPAVLATVYNASTAANACVAFANHASAGVREPAAVVGLTLDQAIDLSLDRNPNLVALRASEPVAHAAYHFAEKYPWNPSLQTEVFPYAHNSDGTGGSVSNYVQLTQTLELAHQQKYREAAAAGDWDLVHWNIIQAELANVAQTERLYFRVLYQRELRDLARNVASLNDDLLGIVERRFEAALATAADRTTAGVTARQSHKEAALAEANFQTAALALRRHLNVSQDEPLTCDCQLEDFRWRSFAGGKTASVGDALQINVSTELIAALANERPDVRAAQAGVCAARAQADLARANRVPNIDIGPVYLRDEVGTVFAGFQSKMDIPVWNTGAPLARQREAEFCHQVTAFDQSRANAIIEAETAIERYERVLRLAECEPATSAAEIPDELNKIRQQYEAGQAGILNVFAVQYALLQERRAYLDLLNELAQAAAEVTYAAGLPPAQLITTSPQPLPSPPQVLTP